MTNTPAGLPALMTTIEITEAGGPEVLQSAQLPVPEPGPGEVLIKVAAAGVNRPDVVQRQGSYPPPPGAPATPGLEIAGTIVAVGPDAREWKIGDTACGLVAGGGYAEYCLAPAVQLLPIPNGFDMVQAAALPETFFTVWSNIFERCALAEGETLLVHGGSSGIGTTAIMLAAAFGHKVLTTAGSTEKCAACLKLGAHKAINYRDEDFVDVAKQATDGKGVDVILDIVGGDYIARNIKALAPDGRLCNIAFLEGSKAEINFMPVMLKRLTLTGSTLRPQPVAAKAAIAEALHRKVWPLLNSGKIAPVIDSTFPLADAAKAHARMESSQHIGKIILVI